MFIINQMNPTNWASVAENGPQQMPYKLLFDLHLLKTSVNFSKTEYLGFSVWTTGALGLKSVC